MRDRYFGLDTAVRGWQMFITSQSRVNGKKIDSPLFFQPQTDGYTKTEFYIFGQKSQPAKVV